MRRVYSHGVNGRALLLLVTLSACQQPVVQGVAQKGPFLLGSAVEVELLTPKGLSEGSVFKTQSIDATGAFSVKLDRPGPVAVSATGQYFDELSGRTGMLPITLRALAVTSDGQVNVNVATHLAHARARRLMEGGQSATAAEHQAEQELRRGLQLGPLSSVPARKLDLLGGDTDDNAWLFALSVVAPYAAQFQRRELSEYLAMIADDLADDGQLEQGHVDDLHVAEGVFNPLQDSIMEANLAAFLNDRGLEAAVPRLDRVMDPDRDGHPSAADDCPRVADADQRDTDGDGVGDACDCGNANLDTNEECDDGNVVDGDGCEADCSLPRCGNGVIDRGELCFTLQDAGLTFPSRGEAVVATLDADRCDDLLLPIPGGVGLLTSDCAGGFRQQSPLALGDGGVPVIRTSDVNRDGLVDLLAMSGGELHVVLARADGGFAAPFTTRPSAFARWPSGSFDVGLFDQDLLPDLVVTDPTASELRVTTVSGDGLGGFTALGGTTTLAAVSMNSTTTSMGGLESDDFDRSTPGSDLVVPFTYVQPGVVGGAVKVYRPQSDGGLEEVGGAGMCQGFAVADFDLDGERDLFSGDCRNTSWLVSGRSLTTVASSPLLPGGGRFLAGDFDGDGRPDVAISRSFAIFRDGGFDVKWAVVGGATFAACPGTQCPRFEVSGDFNGDGRPDLLVDDGTSLLNAH